MEGPSFCSKGAPFLSAYLSLVGQGVQSFPRDDSIGKGNNHTIHHKEFQQLTRSHTEFKNPAFKPTSDNTEVLLLSPNSFC